MRKLAIHFILNLFFLAVTLAVSGQNPADPEYFNFLKKNQVEYKHDVLPRLIKTALKDANLIMVGEMHGTQMSYQFISDFVRAMSKNKDFKYLLIEHDFISAVQINNYLKTGDTTYLNEFFNESRGTFTYNLSYYKFFTSVYEANIARGENKIEVVGVDIQQSIGKGIKYIKACIDAGKIDYRSQLPELENCLTAVSNKKSQDSLVIALKNFTREFKTKAAVYDNLFGRNAADIKYVIKNIDNVLYCSEVENYNDARDEKMYENYLYFNTKLQLSQSLVVGFFGRGHNHKSPSQNENTLTSRICRQFPALKVKAISLYYDTANCRFILPKMYFPNLTDTAHTGYGSGIFFNDNKDFTGLDKLFLASGERKHVIYPLNMKDSPYKTSSDLIYAIRKDKHTLDYIDVAVLIRASEAVIPLKY